MADVSVIIPSFNRQALIGQTLDSVLAQTQPVREVLVIDDGSTDGTPDVISGYEKKTAGLIRLVRQANAGPSAARNHGLQLAQGNLIAFLDADDLWLPQKQEKELALLAGDPSAAGVYCRRFKFQETLDDLLRAEPQDQIDDPALEHIVLTMCIQASTAIVRKEAAKQARFDPTIRAAEDPLYFAQIRLAGTWRMVDEALVAYRVHGQQLTGDADHALRTIEARVNWCRLNAGRLGTERAAKLEEDLFRRFVGMLERMYWRRNLDGLERLRQRARELCPKILAQSFMAHQRIWPRWVYRLRDGLKKS